MNETPRKPAQPGQVGRPAKSSKTVFHLGKFITFQICFLETKWFILTKQSNIHTIALHWIAQQVRSYLS